MALTVNIQRLEKHPAKQGQWDAYVEQHPAGSLYHMSRWRELISELFGHQTFYFYAQTADGEIVGILPLVNLKSRLFGHYMVSMPYFNYGGVLANTPAIEQALLHAAETAAMSNGAAHIEYRDTQSRYGYAVKTEKVNMLLELPAEKELLWKALGTKLRAQIKRPAQENSQVQSGGAELLDEFYQVFSRNMRDLGTPVYAKQFFAEIIRRFPAHAQILIVRFNGEPACGAFLLGYQKRLEIPWASTLKKYNPIGANMLLYWQVLCYAIQNHYTQFDFGRSSTDSGTYRFKKQWGAQPRQLYWHYWLAAHGQMPELNPHNPKYKLVIKVWRRLPVWLTNRLGPGIVKNLP